MECGPEVNQDEYMNVIGKQIDEIVANVGMIRALARSIQGRLNNFDCKIKESEQRCIMCKLNTVSNKVKDFQESAEATLRSLDVAIISKEKADAPKKVQPAEPEKKSRFKIIEAPKRKKKEAPAESTKPDMVVCKKCGKTIKEKESFITGSGKYLCKDCIPVKPKKEKIEIPEQPIIKKQKAPMIKPIEKIPSARKRIPKAPEPIKDIVAEPKQKRKYTKRNTEFWNK